VTSARGIIAAGIIAVVVTATHAAYRVWPVAYGVEACVPAALYRQPAQIGVVLVRLSVERIELDVPHVPPAVTESFEPVQRFGDWWITGGDRTANRRARQGRSLYLQLTSGEPAFPGGPAQVSARTVSDGMVPGAVNLAGA
jgi:hypothetical protein